MNLAKTLILALALALVLTLTLTLTLALVLTLTLTLPLAASFIPSEFGSSEGPSSFMGPGEDAQAAHYELEGSSLTTSWDPECMELCEKWSDFGPVRNLAPLHRTPAAPPPPPALPNS